MSEALVEEVCNEIAPNGDLTFEELVKIANSIAQRAIADLDWDDYKPLLGHIMDEGDAGIVVKLLKQQLSVEVRTS